MHKAGLEIDLFPAQRDQLRDPQPMAVSQEDERPIARTVAADFARGLQQLLDLRRGQVFAGATIKIRLSPWGESRGGGRSRSRRRAFLLRPLEITFPFTSVGGLLGAAAFLEDFAILEV